MFAIYLKHVCDIHYRQKIWNILKAQWKQSYLTFRFAGDGLAPTTNEYCDFNATLTVVLWTKNIICNVKN